MMSCLRTSSNIASTLPESNKVASCSNSMFLFVLMFTSCLALEHPKCCGSDRVLESLNNSDFSCMPDNSKRIQISTNRSDFLALNTSGLCLDVSNGEIRLFEIDQRSVLREVRVLEDVVYESKCCPLGFLYEPRKHGCVRGVSNSNFGESFVRVGLPGCKIIADNDDVQAERYCVDETEDNERVVRSCRDDFQVCEREMCIRKCCPDGQSFVKRTGRAKCEDTYQYGLNFSEFGGRMELTDGPFVTIHEEVSSTIYPLIGKDFHLDRTGAFSMEEIDETVGKVPVLRKYNIEDRAYCVEHALRGNLSTYYFFRDFPKQERQIKFLYTGVAMSISCICLFLTLSYYAISGEKRTLFGKILICYSATALIDFLILCYFAFDGLNPEHVTLCATFAFLILYLTLSVITWTNVMSIDIYCTFGSAKSFSSRQHKKNYWKRFMWYGLHGWGTPLVLTLIPLILHHRRILPSALQPTVDDKKCFLYKGDGNYALFLFSTIPFALLQLCNVILFIKTAIFCLKIKKDIDKMNDTKRGERKQKMKNYAVQYGLLLRLFFIMGILLIFEVVSTFYNFKKNQTTAIIEAVCDTFTSLQGLFIFLIFIVKKKNLNKLKNGIGLKKLRKISLMSSVATQMTSLPHVDK